MLLTADLPQPDINVFDCITIEHSRYIPLKEHPSLINYLITDYPRNDNTQGNSFVYGLFESSDRAFALNQEDIISLAREIFSDSDTLTSLEQEAINNVFKKNLKREPTLKGRK